MPILTAGQALVEVAVVLPLLLVVALGLVQFTLVVHAYNVVTGAAQDGARVAAAVDRTLEDGETHARQVLQAGLGHGARLSVRGVQRPVDDPDVVEIVAQAELQPVVPLGRGATIPLAARASVTKERFRNER